MITTKTPEIREFDEKIQFSQCTGVITFEIKQSFTSQLLEAYQKLDKAQGFLNSIIENQISTDSRKVNIYDLLPMAHRLACSYTVDAPPNWAPVDIRRPCPLETEMKAGFLENNNPS